LRISYVLLLVLFVNITTTHATVKIIKHTTKKGETLKMIAQKNNTSIDEIKKINGLNEKEVETLKPGRILMVPNNKKGKKEKITEYKTCKKQKKFSLFSFAGDKKLSIVELIKKSNEYYAKNASQDNGNRNMLSMPIFIKCTAPDTLASKGVLGNLDDKKISNIISLAKKYLGRKYVWGATGENDTFDCSGLTVYTYKKNNITLPRRAIWQSKVGKYVKFEELKRGDLVFFDTSKDRKGFINHVGIYIGNDKFIQASSASKKVVITSFGRSFYRKRFKWGRRL